jgi:hypothetical protein
MTGIEEMAAHCGAHDAGANPAYAGEIVGAQVLGPRSGARWKVIR